MNTKLIIVWIIAIIVFAAIGLFGKANQHLLDEPDPVPANPGTTTTTPVNTKHNVSCIASIPNGTSSYNFTIDDATNSITDITISYQAINPVDYIYSSAVNLVNNQINGITTNLTGSESDFVLTINTNIQNIDSSSLSIYQNDLMNVSAIIDNISDINIYESTINGYVNSFGSVYNCN